MMLIEDIRTKLFELQDSGYRDMQVKILPTVEADSIIGVRTPELRKLAKSVAREKAVSEFLNDLPHKYFDEDQLHAFIISEMKDLDKCTAELQKFLPYVNNWATCDQMSPKIFKKHRAELLELIPDWIDSDKPYTIRFGIGMLMEHFLDEDFDLKYPEKVASVRSEEYYVNMMIAWYFATALAKQYDDIIPFIEERRLDTWTHNKTIQKSVESYRITLEQKTYLKTLKIKKQ